MSNRPLVTLCLVAYKQERFVREAVQSALAQKYQPLEIIMSDDCSPDRTFDIMREEVTAYQGPHRVVLNRNPVNCGLASNLNRTWELASGDFIVVQAGDDVSLPHRVASLVKAWQAPSLVDLVVSNVVILDGEGRELRRGWPDPVAAPLTLDEAVTSGSCYAIGCAVGYSKNLMTRFGPIDPTVIQEDWVMAFRALAGQGIRVLDEPLLKYRQHGGNVWFAQGTTKQSPTRAQARRAALNRVGIYREWLKAWEKSGRPLDAGHRRLAAWERQWQYDVACYDSNRAGTFWLACRGMVAGLSVRNAMGLIKRHVFRNTNGGTTFSHG
jgi:glycosyltransferase involved in cell wall biosynthesis